MRPAPPPRPTALAGGRARDSLRFSLLAGIAAAFGAGVIPGQPVGLNVVVTATLLGIAVLSLVRADLAWVDLATGALAFALVGASAVRAAQWLVAVDVVLAGGLAAVALAGARDWGAYFRAPFALLARLHRGISLVVSPLHARFRSKSHGDVAPVGRGLLLGTFLVAIFGGLFVSADAAFAQLAQDALIPRWDLTLLPARVLVATLVVSLAGSYVLVSPTYATADRRQLWQLPPGSETRGVPQLQPAEWTTALLCLDALFAAFVSVQLTVLFGGRDHVLASANLTYAEYARQGFFQLLAVAGLTLAVIAAAVSFGQRRDRRDATMMQLLLGVLCALTLVILVSAFTRLNLYEQTYGFTRLRLSVHAVILWLAAIFVLLIVAGALRRGTWLPRAVAVVTALGLLGFNAINPDGFIADRNIDRFTNTGKLDLEYLATLSADAVPPLLRLPEREKNCVLAAVGARLERPSSIWAFNFSRERAQEILRDAPPLISPEACGP